MLINKINLTFVKLTESDKVEVIEDFLSSELGKEALEFGNIVVHSNDEFFWAEINKISSNPTASDNLSISLKRLLLMLL